MDNINSNYDTVIQFGNDNILSLKDTKNNDKRLFQLERSS